MQTKSANQPAHLCSLISPFLFASLISIIKDLLDVQFYGPRKLHCPNRLVQVFPGQKLLNSRFSCDVNIVGTLCLFHDVYALFFFAHSGLVIDMHHFRYTRSLII